MLTIDADEVIKLTNKLEKVHRSALPSAIRNTLNNSAFEVKNQIPIQGKKKFITRNKGFLRSFSTVDKASGFNVDSMMATAGINSKKGSQVAEGLVSQEFGGVLNTSRLVPHDEARTSKSHMKRLRRKNWKKKINAHKATRAYRNHKGTKNSKFVAAVMSTAKSGKEFMILENGGTGMLYRVKGLKSNVRRGKLSFRVEKLFYIKSNDTAQTKGKGFILASKMIAFKKVNEFYENNANYQLKKHWK